MFFREGSFMSWSASDFKFWFYVVAGFTLVYAGCFYLQHGVQMSAENERLAQERGWVTVIPAPQHAAQPNDLAASGKY